MFGWSQVLTKSLSVQYSRQQGPSHDLVFLVLHIAVIAQLLGSKLFAGPVASMKGAREDSVIFLPFSLGFN